MKNEKSRLITLRGLAILDTEPEAQFDDAVLLATAVTGAPIALVSLVDDCRQWFKAKVGLDLTETPVEYAFCSVAVRQTLPLIIEDATTDPRFKDNPLVTGDLHVRAYAGVKIYANGLPMGTVCVIDTSPRHFEPYQIECLKAIARQVSNSLDERLSVQTHEFAARRFESLFQGLPVACFTFDLKGVIQEWNCECERTFGISKLKPDELNVTDIIPPKSDASARERNWIEEVLASRAVEQYEWNHVRADGTVQRIESNFYPLANARGELVGGVSSHLDVTERAAIRDQLLLLSSVAANARNGVVVTDPDEKILYVNPAFEQISGYSLAEVLGTRPGDILTGELTSEMARADMRNAIRQRISTTVETINYHKDGTPYWLQISISPVFDDQGRLTQFVAIEDDVTKRKESEAAFAEAAAKVSESETRLRTVLDAMHDGLTVQNSDGKIVLVNRSAARILELTEDQLLGRTSSDFRMRSVWGDGSEMPTEQHPSMVALRTGVPQYNVGMGFTCGDRVKWLSVSAVPVLTDDGTPEAVVVSFADVSDRHQQQRLIERQMETISESEAALRAESLALQSANEQLARLASTDGLTGLHNHRAFQEFLEQQFLQSKRSGLPVSVLLLDVDHFKSFNDDFGHQAGDNVLREVARCLEAVARGTDFVARYGGEEFVVVLPDTGAEGAIELAERIRIALGAIACEYRAISASIGVATLDSSTLTALQLVGRADQALYRSKQSGRNRVTYFDPVSMAA